jgi:hypothetical protein
MGATTKTLYETDFAAWADEMAAALRAGRLQELDLENLAEEVEGLAKADRRTVRSQLQSMMIHLFKRRIQPERHSRSWDSSILNARYEITDEVEDSPSLRNHLAQNLEKLYQRAVAEALAETGMEEAPRPKQVPIRCPWTLEELLDGDLGSLK